jgi:hypothetical protein
MKIVFFAAAGIRVGGGKSTTPHSQHCESFDHYNNTSLKLPVRVLQIISLKKRKLCRQWR